jgi:predicted dehydrogenase
MKVLMVGLGGIGQRHVRNLRNLLGESVEIAAYRVRGQSAVLTDQLTIGTEGALEEQYQIRVHRDLDRALLEKPDVVFVCNPTSLHLAVGLAAAEAGCDIFMEKPLSHDLTNVAELLALVKKKSLIGMVGYQLRFHPCLRLLETIIRQGRIGSPVAVRVEVGEHVADWHTYEDYRQMYASRQDLGGGVVLSQIHEFDYLTWLFGTPRRVFALGGRLGRLEIDVEDTASSLFDFRVDGRTLPVHVHQDYLQRPPSRTCEVIGDRGKVLVDLRALTVKRYDEQGAVAEDVSFEGFPRNQLFLDELSHFLECVKERRQPLVTLQDGARSLRIALAVKESLGTGSVVEIGESPS